MRKDLSYLHSLESLRIDVAILRGQGLVAKDRNLLGKRTSSDPYVKVFCDGTLYGKTRVISKNLNPEWNETISVKLEKGALSSLIQKMSFSHGPAGASSTTIHIDLVLFDHDKLSDDDCMGVVSIPLHISKDGGTDGANNDGESAADSTSPAIPKSYPVNTSCPHLKYFGKNATGNMTVGLSTKMKRIPYIIRGNSMPISATSPLKVGLAWDVLNEQLGVDLDASCVAVGRNGQVLLEHTVYYGNLSNLNGSIRHSGDETTGETLGDDEVIDLNLPSIPQEVLAMYFLLTVSTPGYNLSQVTSARVKFYQSNQVLCQFVPSKFGDNTCMFLARLTRSDNSLDWALQPIEDGDATARDFGAVIPHVKAYTRDLLPDIYIDPNERIAVLRKNGVIRIKDYGTRSFRDGAKPPHMVFGLAWDVTNGVNIDLDASIICLGEQYQLEDIVSYKQLRSKDGSIVHNGDEREGDEEGDDETIELYLERLSPSIHYLGVVVNSFSQQELDDVSCTSCHLFDKENGRDIATYTLTNSKELDKHTALIFGVLYKHEGEWLFRVISKPAQGKVAMDNVKDLQNFLQQNPPVEPEIVMEPEIDLSVMPAFVPTPVQSNEEDDIIVTF